MQRIASPAIVIGLGSTACQITQHLDDSTSSWSAQDQKSLGFLYLDTREATRDEVTRASRFIALTLPRIGCYADGVDLTARLKPACLPFFQDSRPVSLM